MMGRGYDYGYDMMGRAGLFGGGLLVFLFGALIVAGIVLLVLWAVRSSHGHGAAPPVVPSVGTPPTGAAGHDEAVAIAKRRLVSGEITPEQYQELMRVLGG